MVDKATLTECGTCGFRWDDSVVTDWTPVPSARTPCEYWHVYDETGAFVAVDVSRQYERDFIATVNGSFREHSDPVRFFYEHAGYSYDAPNGETAEQGHLRSARDLAEAEREAIDRGWWVATETDPEGPMEDDAGSVEACESGEYVCLIVDLLWSDPDSDSLLRDPTRLASLGNVIVASDSDSYVRVVGAELAAEVLGDDD